MNAHVSSSLEAIQILIAVGTITLYAWSRYQTPLTVRSDTTWGKFMLGRIAYVGIILVFFIMLVRTPKILIPVSDLAGAPSKLGENLRQLQESASLPLLVALLLTVFLSEIPIFTKLDGALRRYFHNLAAIPRERRYWIHLVKRAPLASLSPDGTLPTDLRTKVVDRLSAHGLGADDVVTETDRSVSSLWTRMTVLLVRLEELQETRRYASLLTDSSEYQALRRGYERLGKKTAHALKLAHNHPRDEAVVLLQKELAEQIETALAAAHDMVSKLVLEAGRTETMRYACIKDFGLDPPRLSAAPSDGKIDAMVLILLVSGSFLGVTASHLGAPRILMIAIGYLGVILAVLALRSARVHLFPRRQRMASLPPVGYYLLSGVAGFCMSAAASIAFRSATSDQPGAGLWHDLVFGHVGRFQDYADNFWPWGLIAFALAAALAALTDDWAERRVKPYRDPLGVAGLFNAFDGAVVALAMGLTAALLTYPIIDGFDHYLGNPLPSSPVWLGLRLAGLGFLLGGLVPQWLRSRHTVDAGELLPEGTAVVAVDG